MQPVAVALKSDAHGWPCDPPCPFVLLSKGNSEPWEPDITELDRCAQAMGAMNRQMNMPALQKIMRDFEMQNERMEMTSDVMGDAIDDAFEVLFRYICPFKLEANAVEAPFLVVFAMWSAASWMTPATPPLR